MAGEKHGVMKYNAWRVKKSMESSAASRRVSHVQSSGIIYRGIYGVTKRQHQYSSVYQSVTVVCGGV